MAFKAIVPTEVEFCSMCPHSSTKEWYNPSIRNNVIDIYCRKLMKTVHINLEKLECCSTGSSLTAEDKIPSDCPYLVINY